LWHSCSPFGSHFGDEVLRFDVLSPFLFDHICTYERAKQKEEENV
jgi:hypothetical protein